MIWCFGFFFLELLDDFDEKSNNDDALASLDDADRNWAAIPTVLLEGATKIRKKSIVIKNYNDIQQ